MRAGARIKNLLYRLIAFHIGGFWVVAIGTVPAGQVTPAVPAPGVLWAELAEVEDAGLVGL